MPSAPNTATAPSLTLSADIFRTTQPASYLYHHLTHTKRRANGRKPTQFRPIHVNTGSLTHCQGSSVVRVGETSVVCGIQAETVLRRDIPDLPRRAENVGSKKERRRQEQDEIAHLCLLVPNVELRTGCSPEFPGDDGPPKALPQALSARLLRLLVTTGLVRLQDLEIRSRVRGDEGKEEEEVVGYWVLYITLMPLSLGGVGSLLDALWGAMYAALRDVKLPRAWWDADREMILCSDAVEEAATLRLRGMPMMASFGVFAPGPHIWRAQKVEEERDEEAMDEVEEQRNWVLADIDELEDKLCEETVSLVVDKTSKGGARINVLGVEKTGGGAVGIDKTKELFELAAQRWGEWKQSLPDG